MSYIDDDDDDDDYKIHLWKAGKGTKYGEDSWQTEAVWQRRI